MKNTFCRTVLLVSALLAGFAHAHPPAIHTDRPTPRLLPLPKGDDVFHFIIFGDRTGGPPEGVEVLAQAVEDTNLLDPDLVMTVGDLIQGYNQPPQWHVQMEEYTGIMRRLRMPWFPVAGNHDIYWRGEKRPPEEHEQAYEKHFGPLWYWFEHKRCGFLVLFSDEGDPADPGKPRAFNDPAQQKFSERQLEWLGKSLGEMKGLQHVFVFMHHPRWAGDIYPGNNWDAVHRLLVDAGNVRACFAGHIHRLRYDGIKDGIEYFALAATGGHIPGEYPRLGYLHHFNLVSVRPGGIKVSVLPVGSVIDPSLFTPERDEDLQRAQRIAPKRISDPVRLAADGAAGTNYEIKLSNPCRRPIEFTLADGGAEGWSVSPDHQHALLKPGAEQTLSFSIRSQDQEFPETTPVLTLAADYLEEGARTTLPEREVPLDVTFDDVADAVFAPAEKPAALHVDGGASGAVVDSSSFELPDGPFTLEAWVMPEKVQETAGIVAKTEGSEFGFHVKDGGVVFLAHLGGRYVQVRSREALATGEWTHVAGVFDGGAMTLYVNGRPSGTKPAKGPRTRNKLPLYLGADPDGQGRPARPFAGWVDEVRLSKRAIYDGGFEPLRRLNPDEATVLLFHADRVVAGVLPDRSRSSAHARLVGKAAVRTPPN